MMLLNKTAARSVAVRSVSGKAQSVKGKTSVSGGKTQSARECEWIAGVLGCSALSPSCAAGASTPPPQCALGEP